MIDLTSFVWCGYRFELKESGREWHLRSLLMWRCELLGLTAWYHSEFQGFTVHSAEVSSEKPYERVSEALIDLVAAHAKQVSKTKETASRMAALELLLRSKPARDPDSYFNAAPCAPRKYEE